MPAACRSSTALTPAGFFVGAATLTAATGACFGFSGMTTPSGPSLFTTVGVRTGASATAATGAAAAGGAAGATAASPFAAATAAITTGFAADLAAAGLAGTVAGAVAGDAFAEAGFLSPQPLVEAGALSHPDWPARAGTFATTAR